MTRTLLMWLWPVRMVITWKPKRWSWKAPDNKQPSASIVISWRISHFIQIISPKVENEGAPVRGRNLRPNFDEKQGTKSWISREEKVFFLNLENREEKEKVFYKILKIERRKRSSIQKSWEPRGEREMIFQNLENREENETWNFTSPAREGKTRIISLREFLEIETLFKDWYKSKSLLLKR